MRFYFILVVMKHLVFCLSHLFIFLLWWSRVFDLSESNFDYLFYLRTGGRITSLSTVTLDSLPEFIDFRFK